MKHKWTPWPSSPKLYIDLVVGRKKVATIRRVGRSASGKMPKQWQVIVRYVDPMGGAVGPIFKSCVAAKRFVEGRLNERR